MKRLNLFTSSFDMWKKRVVRLTVFGISSCIIYVLCLCFLIFLKYAGIELTDELWGANVAPKKSVQFEEAKERIMSEKADILFIGSSHAYRGFDPRIFSERLGKSSFNLGTSAQPPLISYYLLKEYLHQFEPDLVIVETYPILLGSNNMEAFYSLSKIQTDSPNTFNMLFALKSIQATNFYVATNLAKMMVQARDLVVAPRTAHASNNELILDRDSTERQIIPNHSTLEQYIHSGYTENWALLDSSLKQPSNDRWTINPIQLQYLRKIIRYAKKETQVILVQAPVTEELTRNLTFYSELSDIINNIAEEEETLYLDFNEKLPLETRAHFYDYSHLNAHGVKIFNNALIDSLNHHKLLESK